MKNPIKEINGHPVFKSLANVVPFKYLAMNPGNSGRGRTVAILMKSTLTGTIWRRVYEGNRTIGWTTEGVNQNEN